MDHVDAHDGVGLDDRPGFGKDRDSGEWVRTFTIVTTKANELVRKLHDRMPVVIAPEDRERWLSDPSDLLRPFPAEQMTMWPVSQQVNSPKNDNPGLLDPVEDPFSWSEVSDVERANSLEAEREPTNSE